jgi:hypothetical protein
MTGCADAVLVAERVSDVTGVADATAGLQETAGGIEMLAGDAVAAEHELRGAVDLLAQIGDQGSRSTIAAALAHALVEQGRHRAKTAARPRRRGPCVRKPSDHHMTEPTPLPGGHDPRSRACSFSATTRGSQVRSVPFLRRIPGCYVQHWISPQEGATMAAKGKGDSKSSKTAKSKSLKEKRQAKKARAARSGSSGGTSINR